MTWAIVTPGGGGGGCSFLEEQPAQRTSAVVKRARNEACRTANCEFAKRKGTPLFPVDMCCGLRATRKLGSCVMRFSSRSRPSVCENEVSTTSIQATCWYCCRLLDAPKLPKYRLQIHRERGSTSAIPFRPPSYSFGTGRVISRRTCRTSAAQAPELRSDSECKSPSDGHSRPYTATMLGADVGM